MRVLVTGATGFIGSHTVAELVRQGHDVSLFVRTPERVSVALDPLGISGCPFTVGDVTDVAAVEAAMRGCDAVVHCGSVFSLNSRKKAVVRHTNVVGAEVVIGTAHRLGLDPIVQVSSIAALFPPDGRVLTTHSLANEPWGAYFGSKADSDRVATVPGWTLVPVAWLADAVQRVLPFRIPMDIQSFYLTVWDPHCDDSETTGELGITYPSVRDALVETIEWLARTGRLSAKEAGVLAA